MSENEDSRRKSKRYTVSWPSRILLPGKRIISVRVKDVSSGGVGFEVVEKLPTGLEISIEMTPWVRGTEYNIRAKGVITYGMIKGGSAGFSHGLKFTLIPKDQFDVLAGLLKKFEQG